MGFLGSRGMAQVDSLWASHAAKTWVFIEGFPLFLSKIDTNFGTNPCVTMGLSLCYRPEKPRGLRSERLAEFSKIADVELWFFDSNWINSILGS